MVNANVMALLAHGSINYEGVPGGTPQLTAEDVAGALGMGSLPREAYLLGLLKYAEDKTVLHELDRLVQEYVIGVGVKEGWREPWPKEKKRSLMFFKQFARLMINEIVDENICKSCNGTGIFSHSKLIRKCNCTNGKKALSKLKQAKFCNINHQAWNERWYERYSHCLKQIHVWHASVIFHLINHI
ncbi:hypothetical protein H0A36_28520 [Endozoicomonas sp. SM1973]|uniref:Uncharacterized protein n=1 Tax=Spartinivicinus marinus TaxID=2994442 RepID=A0A853IDN0_9GAMM|nr:hypothetical protein [Spartinivicinus marinus]MCX4027917.1 hypothetical protein [Spartinivicinus marinus]NYZ69962.1 hypothetical protein [Spartinivicinus marinus]